MGQTRKKSAKIMGQTRKKSAKIMGQTRKKSAKIMGQTRKKCAKKYKYHLIFHMNLNIFNIIYVSVYLTCQMNVSIVSPLLLKPVRI
jgi:hypothetical protein